MSTGDTTTMNWLHVYPEARGQGIGTALVERAQEVGEIAFRARVLTDSVEGRDFLEVFRLTRSGTEESEFGGEEYRIDIFTIVPDTEFGSDQSVEVPESVRVDDAERYLDQADLIPDTTAPVFQLYSDTGGRFRSSIFVLGVAVRTFQLTVLSGSYSTNVVPNTTRRSGRRLSSRPVVGTERAPSLTLERHS